MAIISIFLLCTRDISPLTLPDISRNASQYIVLIFHKFCETKYCNSKKF